MFYVGMLMKQIASPMKESMLKKKSKTKWYYKGIQANFSISPFEKNQKI